MYINMVYTLDALTALLMRSNSKRHWIYHGGPSTRQSRTNKTIPMYLCIWSVFATPDKVRFRCSSWLHRVPYYSALSLIVIVRPSPRRKKESVRHRGQRTTTDNHF